MGRPQSRYVCQSCGEAFLRWEGQCRACLAWNSLVETLVPEGPSRRPGRASGGAPTANVQPLRSVVQPSAARWTTGIGELDRVLGGGLVPGSIVLIGGEPGIGKSTLVLQAAAGAAQALAAQGRHVLYATGEESAAQVHLRATRLGLLEGPAGDGIRIMAERSVDLIGDAARSDGPAVLVVDSIQTAIVEALEGPAGSVGQVRESALRLMELAKGEGVAVVLVGHVTKEGTLAGPRTLEHLVDAVLSLEGERFAGLRLLRAAKNRFGSTEEVGVLEMRELGLVEVADPGRAFLVDRPGPAAGSIVAPVLEGTRPILVEIQALVSPGGYSTPLRRASGVDASRLALLVAVLGRRAGIGLSSHDLYVNAAGGLAVVEPGVDLPIAIALASSLRDIPVATATVAIGEIGLLGELRTVSGLDRRLGEAARLGFRRAIVPRADRRRQAAPPPGFEVVEAASLRDALDAALEGPVSPIPSAPSARPSSTIVG